MVREPQRVWDRLGMWLSPRQKMVLLAVRNGQFREEQDDGRGPRSPYLVVIPFLPPLGALYQDFLFQPRALRSWMCSQAA